VTALARMALVVLVVLVTAVLGGCAAGQDGAALTALEGADIPEGRRYAIDQRDPLEIWNRRVYGFNHRVDRWLWLPTVRVYEYFTPEPVRSSVGNFFANLTNITDAGNNMAQLKFDRAGISGLRLLVNSTVGLAGLFDPAARFGLYQQQEDFGQTLGHWGVGPGPYLVLPLLGPSNLRDAGGFVVDWTWTSFVNPFIVYTPFVARVGAYTVYAVDERASLSFRYYGSGSPFEYEAVRSLYLRYRRIQVER
jgi:phospholipid-binding lipoprotein MlaA